MHGKSTRTDIDIPHCINSKGCPSTVCLVCLTKREQMFICERGRGPIPVRSCNNAWAAWNRLGVLRSYMFVLCHQERSVCFQSISKISKIVFSIYIQAKEMAGFRLSTLSLIISLLRTNNDLWQCLCKGSYDFLLSKKKHPHWPSMGKRL